MRSDELCVGVWELALDIRSRMLKDEPRVLLQQVIDRLAPATAARSCRVLFRDHCAEWEPSGWGPDDDLLPPGDFETVIQSGTEFLRLDPRGFRDLPAGVYPLNAAIFPVRLGAEVFGAIGFSRYDRLVFYLRHLKEAVRQLGDLAGDILGVALLRRSAARLSALQDEDLRRKAEAERRTREYEDRLRTAGLESDIPEIVGCSPARFELCRQIVLAAASDCDVLVEGETGTGKELVARAIHERSSRRDAPCSIVNIASFEGALLRSELFGCVKHSHSEAKEDHTGVFETASGGTVGLDEIGDIEFVLPANSPQLIWQETT